MSNQDSEQQDLADFISAHERLFVLTGAGCSTSSGLGDYRDKQGRWKTRQPITGQLFIADETARKRYWARSFVGWPSFSRAEPGLPHLALRKLQQTQKLELLVTQNVDRLHQKAGHTDVVDLHGVLATLSCLNCQLQISRDEFQSSLLSVNTWLDTLNATQAPDGDAHLEVENLANMHIPGCTRCSGLMKPDVVFFGENVAREKVDKAMDALHSADALLVVGSSLMVYSGYRFCRQAQRRGIPIAIINNGLTRADDMASLKIQGDCGQRLAALL